MREDLHQRLKKPFPITDELNEFGEHFHANPQKVSMLLTILRCLRVDYEFGRVEEWETRSWKELVAQERGDHYHVQEGNRLCF